MWPDGWTAVTADGKRSAQFEHTLLVSQYFIIYEVIIRLDLSTNLNSQFHGYRCIAQVTETGVEVLTARLPSSPNVFPWLNA